MLTLLLVRLPSGAKGEEGAVSRVRCQRPNLGLRICQVQSQSENSYILYEQKAILLSLTLSLDKRSIQHI